MLKVEAEAGVDDVQLAPGLAKMADYNGSSAGRVRACQCFSAHSKILAAIMEWLSQGRQKFPCPSRVLHLFVARVASQRLLS